MPAKTKQNNIITNEQKKHTHFSVEKKPKRTNEWKKKVLYIVCTRKSRIIKLKSFCLWCLLAVNNCVTLVKCGFTHTRTNDRLIGMDDCAIAEFAM